MLFLLILQPSRHSTYVTAHSPTLPSLYLRHSSFSNPPVASPTSQLILQPFFRFSYVIGSSLTSPGEPPMVYAKLLSCVQSENIAYSIPFASTANATFSSILFALIYKIIFFPLISLIYLRISLYVVSHCHMLFWKLSSLELKEKNSILDRDLNPGLLSLYANAFTRSSTCPRYN